MFLTLEDPRAKVKGFRDPLGIQALWTGFGRRLVFNLTTVTSSVRSFTVLLLGRWITERLVEDNRIPRDGVLNAFLRFEQIAGYARHLVCDDGNDVRGIERIRARCVDRRPVKIGVRPDELILGDQKVYGLWGLFSVSARSTGWLEEGPIGLTTPARAFIEREYAPHLSSVERELFALVEEGGALDLGNTSRILGAVGKVLSRTFSASEVAFYGEWLRDAAHVAGPDAAAGRQSALATALLRVTPEEARVDSAVIGAASAGLRSEGRAEISDALDRAVALEAFLAPAEVVFESAISSGRSIPLAEFSTRMHTFWPRGIACPDRAFFRSLGGEIRLRAGSEVGDVIDRAFDRLASQEWDELVRELAAWNALVMKARKAGPWLEVSEGAIEIRYRGTEREIERETEPARLWRNSYFLDALLAIARQIRGTK